MNQSPWIKLSFKKRPAKRFLNFVLKVVVFVVTFGKLFPVKGLEEDYPKYYFVYFSRLVF